MASPGQLKTKIDLLQKRIAEKGSSLQPDRQRLYRKRLKRLQRARRTAVSIEKKIVARRTGKKGAGHGAAEGAEGGSTTAAPA